MAACFVECWKCEVCGHRWIKTETWPETCARKACRSRKWNKTGGVAQPDRAPAVGLGEAGSIPAPQIKTNMDALRAICAGNVETQLQAMRHRDVEPLPDPLKICEYTEYDQDTGETYVCRLPVHPAKVKHQRGPAL